MYTVSFPEQVQATKLGRPKAHRKVNRRWARANKGCLTRAFPLKISLGRSEVLTIIPVFQMEELGLRKPYALFQHTVTEHTPRVGTWMERTCIGDAEVTQTRSRPA